MVFTSSLKGRYLFKKILRRAKYYSDDNITVYAMKNGEDKNYLGICVSKKHGNSVTRNKLKRWAREGYKELESKLKVGYNIIILYKKKIQVEKLDFTKVKNEIEQGMKEIEVM